MWPFSRLKRFSIASQSCHSYDAGMSIYRNNLRTSDAGLDLIKRWEKFMPNPYLCSAGKWTIGYGHRLTPYEIRNPRNILMAEALQYLRDDVRNKELLLNSVIRVPVTQYQFDALVSLAFNVRWLPLENSTLLRKLNAGDIAGAADEFPRWNKQISPKTGEYEVVKGLTNRRMQERAMFMGNRTPAINVPSESPAEKLSIFSGLKQWLIGDLK